MVVESIYVCISLQTIIQLVHELRQIAFDVEPDPKPGSSDRRQTHDRDFKKLGFQVILWIFKKN